MLELIHHFIDVVLHLDLYLSGWANAYGIWIYGILFVVVFCETGLVVTPFLPGDSLLFAAGAVAATAGFNPHSLVLLLVLAPLAGDNTNYWIGYHIGPRIFRKPKSLFFNPEYLNRTHQFYEKHGGKTIIIARFMPIIRTFAPFVAGIGRMPYLRFLAFCVTGALLWVPSFIYTGYFFGNLPFVKKNFTLVIFAIIFISILPGIIGALREKFGKRQ
jgi:membrane-associated protein